MFIAPMPEEVPTGYRKEVLDWLSQSVSLNALLRNWGAGSRSGFAQATGIAPEKLRGLGIRQEKVAAAIWLESVIWADLKGPSSLDDYRRAITRKYGV